MWQPRPIDWILWTIFTAVTCGMVFLYANFSKNPYSKYMIRGYLIKAFGGLGFALVYIYYYHFGDTFRYYYDAIKLSETFSRSPMTYVRLLFTSFDSIQNLDSDLMIVIKKCYFSFDKEGWFMARITSIFAIFTSNSYIGATYFMSFISFIGSYQLFKLSNLILNDKPKWAFAIAFLIPSTAFWGGGILKDNYTLFASSIFIYTLYKLMYTKSSKVWNIAVMLAMAYIIYTLKAYIIICLIPWVIVTAYLNFSRKVNSQMIRLATAPIIMGAVFASGFLLSTLLIDSSDKYNTEVIETRAKGFQKWHRSLGGSYYELGEIEYTPVGILRVAPKALSATLFQPFPWEVRNPFMLLNSIEGFVFLFLVLQIFWHSRRDFFSLIYRNEYLFGALIFCIIFGVAVGMNSYNYGALARYKLPILSTFLLILGYVRVTQIDRKKEKKRLDRIKKEKITSDVIES
ncbi:MAG: hypothetical protein EP338_08690 [Bacteroidetes bacterium]|nr:MAG: hypothetical protein EP338_08690 [Bacteroidota bacterium]